MAMKKFVCDHPWTHFEVNNPNGDVTMCCDNNTVLGNINRNSIPEIWNGPGYQDMRRRMRDEGAHAFCPHACPILNGGKIHQQIDWQDEMAPESPARRNAEENIKEYRSGALALASLPRFMRFTYSYLCNLDCYHCYQREDAVQELKLPETFMREIEDMAPIFQVVYAFGGEPFLFKPVLRFIETIKTDPQCRYFFATNATILTEPIMATLRRRNIGLMSASLDAADSETFQELRVRGRTGDWNEVMANLKKLRDLKREKGFPFTLSLTLNTRNHDQIETFVRLALDFDAEPLIFLVTNPYQTLGFQKDFLSFGDNQFKTMFAQIERSIPEVRARGFADSLSSLEALDVALRRHRAADNNLAYYTGKKIARTVFRQLPEALQRPIKSAVQTARRRRGAKTTVAGKNPTEQ